MPNRINVNQWEEMIRAVPRGPGQLFGLAPEQIIVDDILPKYKFTVKKSRETKGISNYTYKYKVVYLKALKKSPSFFKFF